MFHYYRIIATIHVQPPPLYNCHGKVCPAAKPCLALPPLGCYACQGAACLHVAHHVVYDMHVPSLSLFPALSNCPSPAPLTRPSPRMHPPAPSPAPSHMPLPLTRPLQHPSTPPHPPPSPPAHCCSCACTSRTVSKCLLAAAVHESCKRPAVVPG